MMYEWIQAVLAGTLVTAACAYVIRRSWRRMQGTSGACGGCAGCAAKPVVPIDTLRSPRHPGPRERTR